MAIEPREMSEMLEDLIRATARLQARHDMLECFVRALLAEARPASSLLWKVLEAARQEWDQRQTTDPAGPWLALDTAALGLWNELRDACIPSTGSLS